MRDGSKMRRRRFRSAALAVALAASLTGALSSPAAAGSGGATVYYGRTSCLGTETTSPSGTVDYTRSGKIIDVDVSLTGSWSNGSHGVLLFALTPNGGCPSSGQFLGTITTSGGGGSGDFLAKIKGAPANHDVTVVLCVGDSGPHFSDSATLSA